MSREQYEGAESPTRGKPGDHRDAISEALTDDVELAPVVEAMVATLEEEALPAGGWEALRVKLERADGPRATDRGASPATLPAHESASAATELDATASAPLATPLTKPLAGPHTGPLRTPTGTRHPIPDSSRGTNAATRWVVAAVLAAAVVVAGSWGSLKAGEAAKLRDDQRILAYWMANPDMQLVALSAPGSAPDAGPARLGVVCVLPDGRALLLQPTSAPPGATYVVTGRGPDGTQELVRGKSNMLQFDASGVQAVEVVIAEGNDTTELIAEAALGQTAVD